MPFLLPYSLVCTAPSTQGHVEAAATIGGIYGWGQGVAVDCERALAAYKTAAEGGNADCQYNLGHMLSHGQGIDSPDYEQALVWYEKAAAQGLPFAVNSLGSMAQNGLGQPPSWRRARELYRRAANLGCAEAATNMQNLAQSIANVITIAGCHSLPHAAPTPP